MTVGIQGLLALEASRSAREVAREIEGEERAERRSKYLKRAAGVFAALIGGGGIGGWKMVQTGEPAPIETVQPAVIVETSEIDDEIERRFRLLGERALTQDVQMVDGLRYIGDKIDLAHPEFKGQTTKPKSIEAAEKRVAEIKKDRALDELFAHVPAPGEDKSTGR